MDFLLRPCSPECDQTLLSDCSMSAIQPIPISFLDPGLLASPIDQVYSFFQQHLVVEEMLHHFRHEGDDGSGSSPLSIDGGDGSGSLPSSIGGGADGGVAGGVS